MQNRLPPLATRLQTLLDEKFNKDTQQQQTLAVEYPPAEEERGIKGPPLFSLLLSTHFCFWKWVCVC